MPVTPTEYEPTYVAVTAVPIEIEDTYSTEDKREALFNAERQLELDINGGVAIDSDDVTGNHHSAVLNLATYFLARGAVSNDDVTLGDVEDGGERQERHAEQYLETYDRMIEKIAEAGGSGQPGSYMGATGTGGGATATNSGLRHSLRPNTDERTIVHDDYVDEDN